jgi:hypothetical protein
MANAASSSRLGRAALRQGLRAPHRFYLNLVHEAGYTSELTRDTGKSRDNGVGLEIDRG